MEAENVDAVTTPSGTSIPRTVKASKLTTSRKRIEAVEGKCVNEKQDGSEVCRKNYKKITDLKDFSSECGYTTKQNRTSHCRIENNPIMDLPDMNRHDAASKPLVLPHGPVPTGPNGLAGDQFVPHIQDGQEPKGKRRKISLKRSTKTSTVCEQEIDDDLEAKIEELKKETAVYSSKLKCLAESCYHLKEENDLLLDELRQWCTPEMMIDLERSNPDRSRQSNDMTREI